MNSKDKENISSIVKSVYHPSTIERKLKSRFWTYWLEGPSKGTPTIEDVHSLLQEPALERKAENPAFVSWFLNRFEAVEKVRYLAQLGLEVVEEILTSAGERTSDKLKAVALINDLVKATAPKQEVKYADEQINSMSEDQLEDLIKRLK
jgi:hypothetical protein